jgi:hypothetical protein
MLEGGFDMPDLTARLDEYGSMTLASSRQPPPPVIPRSVYLQSSSDSGSISAVSLVVPSLSKRQAEQVADVLRKAADELMSPAVVRRAGSSKDPGVTVDLSAVMVK